MLRPLAPSVATLLVIQAAAWAMPQSPSGPFVGLAAGSHHTLAPRSDGSVVARGDNSHGQCDVPAPPVGERYVELTAGGGNSLDPVYSAAGFSAARLSNGTVVAWGENNNGQCNVPGLTAGLAYVQVDAGPVHVLGLRSDGSIESWGSYSFPPPALPAGLTYIAVAAGGSIHEDMYACCWGQFWDYFPLSAGLRSDGSIVVWGRSRSPNSWSSGPPPPAPALPTGLTYVEVSAGGEHFVALRSDGVVVAWGANHFGQCNVPVLSPGLTYVAIDAGAAHTLARRSDGSLVAWGHNLSGQCDVPPLPPGLSYVEIAAGGALNGLYEFFVSYTRFADGHSVARRSDGSVVAWGSNWVGQCDLPGDAGALRYCSSTVNSTGNAATIHALGSSSLASNDLVLSAVGVPDGAFMFIRGDARAQSPLGNGALCVGGGIHRMHVPGQASNGLAQVIVDLAGTGITVPGVQTFQCWFRDVPGGGAGANTSDGVEITFVP
jgi:alpha-tubulin suppressor-like RCC1 family protein